MRIALTPLCDADLPLLRRWLYADHVAGWFEHPRDWLYEAENRDTEFSWIRHFIARMGGVPVGFCQYYAYDRGGEIWHGDMDTRGVYSIDYLLGDAAYLGKGLGREMILALVARLSSCERARCVIVQPDERNLASRGALRSAGFVYDEARRLYRLELPGGETAG